MNEQQRTAALRLADDLEYENQKVSHDAADLLRELAREPCCVCGEPNTTGVVHRTDGPCHMAEPVQGELVAWMLRGPRETVFLHGPKPPLISLGWEPLYAAPQQRQPLTEVQITELAEQCGYDGAVPTVRLAFQGFKLDDFAHAVERFHGITGGKE